MRKWRKLTLSTSSSTVDCSSSI